MGSSVLCVGKENDKCQVFIFNLPFDVHRFVASLYCKKFRPVFKLYRKNLKKFLCNSENKLRKLSLNLYLFYLQLLQYLFIYGSGLFCPHSLKIISAIYSLHLFVLHLAFIIFFLYLHHLHLPTFFLCRFLASYYATQIVAVHTVWIWLDPK